MKSRRWRFRLLSGAAIGTWFAILGSTSFAAAPTWNRDTAGALGTKADVGPASLAITVRSCPASYDPTRKDADFSRDCTEPAGDTNFQLSQDGAGGASASTGTSGNAPQESTVRFSNLTAGSHTIVAKAPADIGGAFVGSCRSDARSFDAYPFVPFAKIDGGSVTLNLVAGESLSCDWYQIKSDATT
jgi:hypothetical protein